MHSREATRNGPKHAMEGKTSALSHPTPQGYVSAVCLPPYFKLSSARAVNSSCSKEARPRAIENGILQTSGMLMAWASPQNRTVVPAQLDA